MQLLGEMKEHAQNMAQAITRGNFQQLGTLVGKTWQLNQLLDSGTNPQCVQSIIEKVQDYCLGLKLPGAGGGGFLYMIAKDSSAALRIREILTNDPPNPRARFVDMNLSQTGFQLSRS
jgi:galactokinase/mevalonate kinase-like predicted kinase